MVYCLHCLTTPEQTENVVSPKDLNQRYIVISYEGRYTEQEKKIIFPRGLLNWLLPISTLPYVWCEIREKMQVVYKELTRNWVNSKVAESQFYS